MLRKRFDHLVEEISMAVGAPIPRYRLWLRFHEHGCDPESITANMAVAFCDGPLKSFLREEGLRIGNWARHRVRKEVLRYDPRIPRPKDRLSALPE
jgi:hypothetical protein